MSRHHDCTWNCGGTDCDAPIMRSGGEMSDIETFVRTYDGMEPYQYGEWVRLSDYNKLRKQLEQAEARCKDLELVLRIAQHYHVNNGVDNFCKQCGLYLTHPVHFRGAFSPTVESGESTSPASPQDESSKI